MDDMEYILRIQERKIKELLKREKSILLLGPRQTGKSTLLKNIKADLSISFLKPEIRIRYEKNPELLEKEINALLLQNKNKHLTVIIDEIQKIPQVLDVIQYIIDNKKAIFVLTGSSARKLKRGNDVNLLPGRLISVRLDPFVINEISKLDIMEMLMFGSLPGIYTIKNLVHREEELESYVTNYLEEEVRAEAIVRNLGSFARFLELAAQESGNIINLRSLSQEIGVSHTTISSYFQILEDCLIIERIEPITESKTRKRLTKAQKYLFFDQGVRRISAGEGKKQPNEYLGKLFEQFVGLELIRCSRLSKEKYKIKFWRDSDGPEVDWVAEKEGLYIPIEVKFTDTPSEKDIKHLKVFLNEYKNSTMGYVICQTPRMYLLDKNILAIPWQEIDNYFLDLK